MDARRTYLDPAVLSKLHGLELRARRLVEGFISGMHRSPYRGYSVEFAEHRKYSQGDDLRHLDWKVYGRTDKHYVKQFEQETNLHLLLAVDCSESMSYRWSRSPLSKGHFAATLAAAMAYLALQQSDAVSVALFDDRLKRVTRPTNHPAHWKAIVRELEHAGTGTGTTAIRGSLDALAESLGRRHMVVLLSDLLPGAEDAMIGVKHLLHRGHEVLVMQVLDHAELTFPFEGPTQFRGLEGAGRIRIEPRAMRREYLAALESALEALRRGCRRERVDYRVFDTSESAGTALSMFLATRAGKLARTG